MRRQLERERSIAALVLANPVPVKPHHRSRHSAFEIHKHVAALALRRHFEAAAVDGHELIGFFIKAVPRKPQIGMRNRDSVKAGVVKTGRRVVFKTL